MITLLDQRRAGILLHITSLPGSLANGDLGQDAYQFVHYLHRAGIRVWQTLPLGQPHFDGSPYQCLSAHAGNTALIDLQPLVDQAWLPPLSSLDHFPKLNKDQLIFQAFQQFSVKASTEQQQQFSQFCQQQVYWLEDFALFMALRREFQQQGWNLWPEALKQREPQAIAEAKQRLSFDIQAIQFGQYLFFQQWHQLKQFAQQHDILLFGDMPLFVSYDSADVWANRHVFKLESNGEMSVVAGVPPDYFSQYGQRWGNPHYDWAYLEQSGFDWWIQRLRTQLDLFDILRIDHFRGLQAAWEIPAHEATAINGQWKIAPGQKLLQALQNAFGTMPLIAEDLGIITAEVEQLRQQFQLPGMKILQFAFSEGADNPYLPAHYSTNSVVYTGTHDNDTTMGWYNSLSDHDRAKIYQLLHRSHAPMPQMLIESAMASVSNLAIIPLQDLLGLDSSARMNIPGTIEGNWQWRFEWSQLTSEKITYLADLIRATER
ncbi:MAG: hypothetical protein RL637_997 [Pseudomonadota bacterium]